MIGSLAQSRRTTQHTSSEKCTPTFSVVTPIQACSDGPAVLPGQLNDTILIRQLVTAAMADCGLSRAQIAERMSLTTGTAVTERMLNNFSANCRTDVRFPSELERAFCEAVGDNRLLVSRAELSGMRFFSPEEEQLMELGREYLRQKRASSRMAALETRLSEVSL